MAGEIRIGTSGWNYRHWKGRFYPEDVPRKNWFKVYAEHFDTVEINNTFYNLPEAKTFDDWRQQAARDFVYSVKANRYLTHIKRLKEPKEPLHRFLTGVRRLKDHLGPILYQLPPNWNRNFERLENFVATLPDHVSHVVEFRNRDWLGDEIYDLLREYNIGLCVHDMLRNHPRRVTGPLVYLRFHGSGSTYGGKYRKRRLKSWADWMSDVSADHDVFAYFNNDENAYAVANAKQLRDLLGVDR